MKSQIILPSPPKSYDANDQAQMRRAIAAEDLNNIKVNDYATALLRGIVKIGTGITVTADGTISAVAYTEGTWTPADASGASLVLTVTRAVWRRIGNLMFVQASITYPTTASGSNAIIGGLPVAVPTNGDSMLPCLPGNVNGAIFLLAAGAGSNAQIFKATGHATNANMSATSLVFSGCYPVT